MNPNTTKRSLLHYGLWLAVVSASLPVSGLIAQPSSSGPATGKTEVARVPTPQPDLPNVRYGPHESNVLDLWKAKLGEPTPLVIFIHGGGFRGGDKSSVNASVLNAFLNAGYSYASLNYRLTNVAPAPAAYLDCARAIQFLRHHAKEYNIDPRLIASTGGSAGAGTSMWIAFHDDMADPQNADPVARQSTRLVCVAVLNGQSSYDPRFAEKAGIPRPNFERHPFFLPFYDIKADEIDTPKAYSRYNAFAPVTYLTKDDPPAFLDYSYANEEVSETSSLSLVVHHPKLGLALKRRMDALGIECVVQYRSGGREPRVTQFEFIRKHIEAARNHAVAR
jgi:acetyl esterase